MGALEQAEALATPEYWDDRYAQSEGDKPTHEWLISYDALEPFFRRHLFAARNPDQNPRIVHLGSGDSTIPVDLATKGYKNQLCVDFSTIVVDLMSKRHSKESGIEWQWADLRDMKDVPDNTVDTAFDKSTLDAMISGSPWDPPDIVKENSRQYLREVFRVLRDSGTFLCITFRQPHFIKPLLNQGNLWDLQMEHISDGASSFDYFGFVLEKKKVETKSV